MPTRERRVAAIAAVLLTAGATAAASITDEPYCDCAGPATATVPADAPPAIPLPRPSGP